LATVLWRAASLLGELTICALLELARWGLRSSPRLPPQPLAPSVALPLGWGLATCLAGLP
ncbi:MAG: hypothetical protein ACKOGA_00305, partial [Planctomycetaceae bacterium]